MAQMNISLPDALKGWAEQRVAERLRAAWDDGLASGPAVDAPEDWAGQVVKRGLARLNAKSVA